LLCPQMTHHWCGKLHFSGRRHLINVLANMKNFTTNAHQRNGTYMPLGGPFTLIWSTLVHWQPLKQWVCLFELFGGINIGLTTMWAQKYLYVDPNTIAQKVSMCHVGMLLEWYLEFLVCMYSKVAHFLKKWEFTKIHSILLNFWEFLVPWIEW
jgi:hypothetical protein